MVCQYDLFIKKYIFLLNCIQWYNRSKNSIERAVGMDVYEALREEILSGKIKLGSRLIEKDLAERFHISRTPIREAIRRLESEGLVVLTPNRGASVRDFTLKNVSDTFNLRAQIEGYACALAAENCTEEGLATLKNSIYQSEKALELYRQNKIAECVSQLAESNLIFHNTIISLAGNEEIPKVLTPLITLPVLIRGFYWYNYNGILNSINQHKSIYEAIKNHDPLVARIYMEAHLFTGRDNIITNLTNNHSLEHYEDIL